MLFLSGKAHLQKAGKTVDYQVSMIQSNNISPIIFNTTIHRAFLFPWCVMYHHLLLPFYLPSHSCLSFSPTCDPLLDHGSDFTISHSQSRHEHPSLSRSIPGTSHRFQCNGHCCCYDVRLGLCSGPQFHVTVCIPVHQTSSN